MTSTERFRALMRDYPILAVLYGTDQLPTFLRAQSRVAFVGRVDLFKVKSVADQISANGKLVIVNIDETPGLAADEVGLNYLTSIGVRAVATKDPNLIPKIKDSGSLAFQKVYITNRSNLAKISEQIIMGRADVVQVQPAPILAWLSPEERARLRDFVAAGFIQTADDARNALDHGAFAVSTRYDELWSGFTR